MSIAESSFLGLIPALRIGKFQMCYNWNLLVLSKAQILSKSLICNKDLLIHNLFIVIRKKMKGSRSFLVGLVLILVLSSLDLISTWILTPDLSEESNIFVSVYGFGWLGLIFSTLYIILFVLIPFYYHALVFKYSHNVGDRYTLLSICRNYFLKNDINIVLSIGKAFFNLLGFFLFWYYILAEIFAIAHNLMYLAAIDIYKFSDFSNTNNSLNINQSKGWLENAIYRYCNLSMENQLEILNLFKIVGIISLSIIFFSIFIKRLKANTAKLVQSRRFPSLNIVVFFILLLSFCSFMYFGHHASKYELDPTVKVDQDIVLVNIGNLDRAGIGNLILSIDSSNPALIGINILFNDKKESFGDSVLVKAFTYTKKGVLSYFFDTRGVPIKFPPALDSIKFDRGYVSHQLSYNLVTHFTPLKLENGDTSKSLALKIVEKWVKKSSNKIKPNKSIPIRFERSLHQYYNFGISDLENPEIRAILKDKIVLLGYLGPRNEDKYFTPLRFMMENVLGNPDTYGVVIIANEIRTILYYFSD